MHPKHQDGRPAGLARRDFMAMGAAAALAQTLSPAGHRLVSRPLSVGYVLGSDVLPDFDTLPASGPDGEAWRIAPARALASESGLAGAGIRIRIFGLRPQVDRASLAAFDGLTLQLVLPPPAPEAEAIVFNCWSCGRGPARSEAAGSDFRAAVAADGTLGFALLAASRRRGALGALVPERRLVARFGETGGPALRRGVYLLGLRPNTWSLGGALPAAGEAPVPALASVGIAIETRPDVA